MTQQDCLKSLMPGIRASVHASAVGPVDEEQRYYLESRGVPTEIADRLIVSGFLNEMIDRVPVAQAREFVRTETRSRLGNFLSQVNA